MIKLRLLFRWLAALSFVVAGANHFRHPEFYLGMMPPALPWPQALNYISGAAEILGGLVQRFEGILTGVQLAQARSGSGGEWHGKRGTR